MGRFRVATAIAVVLLVAGCASTPPATPGESVASLVGTPEPSVPASVGPVIPVQLPAELRSIAWSRLTRVTNADGTLHHVVVEAGLLGRLSTFTASIPADAGAVTAATGGPYVAIVRSAPANGRGRIDVLDARIDATVGTVPFDGRAGLDPVLVDPDGQVLYGSSPTAKGGVEIFRVAFDGSKRTSLIRLDQRFAGDQFPVDRFGATLTASGTLVAIACGVADGCRVWEVPQGAKAAPPPIRLAATVPVMCIVAAASDDVLIVYDPARCSDEGGIPLAVRAIDLGDGSTHLLAVEPNILVKRVVDVGGKSLAVGSVAAGETAYTIDTIDADTGARSVIAGPLVSTAASARPLPTVSSTNLPGAWVLVAPPGPSSTDPSATTPAVLIDASAGTAIQLPFGTYGWEAAAGG